MRTRSLLLPILTRGIIRSVWLLKAAPSAGAGAAVQVPTQCVSSLMSSSRMLHLSGRAAQLGDHELIELCMLVGHYEMLAMTLNSLGVEAEPSALAALDAGRLGGIGLDVFDPEPPPHHPLFDHPNVVLTPHLMGLTRRATAATFAAAARGVSDVLAGRRPAALANPDWTPAGAATTEEA